MSGFRLDASYVANHYKALCLNHGLCRWLIKLSGSVTLHCTLHARSILFHKALKALGEAKKRSEQWRVLFLPRSSGDMMQNLEPLPNTGIVTDKYITGNEWFSLHSWVDTFADGKFLERAMVDIKIGTMGQCGVIRDWRVINLPVCYMCVRSFHDEDCESSDQRHSDESVASKNTERGSSSSYAPGKNHAQVMWIKKSTKML